MLGRFTPSARQAVVRAGLAAVEAGRTALGTEFLLLGLTETHGSTPPLDGLGVTAAGVRAEIERGGARPRPDRELLATLGIDLDEVRRRAAEATAMRPDDPAWWELRRSRVRPLRVALVGPAVDLPLEGQARKAIEVAMWASGRRAGRHALVAGEDLLWGLLADGSNQSVRILVHLGVDLRRLWSELRRRGAAA